MVIALLLTLGLASFAIPINRAEGDNIYLLNLPRAAYGLLGLVLLFDIYVVYQQLQIHRMHLRMHDQQEIFRLIRENAADMIAAVTQVDTGFTTALRIRKSLATLKRN